MGFNRLPRKTLRRSRLSPRSENASSYKTAVGELLKERKDRFYWQKKSFVYWCNGWYWISSC